MQQMCVSIVQITTGMKTVPKESWKKTFKRYKKTRSGPNSINKSSHCIHYMFARVLNVKWDIHVGSVFVYNCWFNKHVFPFILNGQFLPLNIPNSDPKSVLSGTKRMNKIHCPISNFTGSHFVISVWRNYYKTV